MVSSAQLLEEAWEWGVDVDLWRAHLNPLTWPEVMRQFGIVAGVGGKRPRPKKDIKPKLGVEGEDVVEGEGEALKLKLPSRLGVGTVKAAAWRVLSEVDYRGIPIAEIARRIQLKGYRDLRTSKTPEASVAGALSRDVVFCRTAPATYALQAIVAHHNRSSAASLPNKAGEVKAEPATTSPQEKTTAAAAADVTASGSAADGSHAGRQQAAASIKQEQDVAVKQEQDVAVKDEAPTSNAGSHTASQVQVVGEQDQAPATAAATAAGAAGGGGGDRPAAHEEEESYTDEEER